MTDEKKPWRRCPTCKWRVWNDPIDWHAHLELCPAVLEKKILELGRIIVRLEKQERPAPVQVPVLPDFGAIEEPDEDDEDEILPPDEPVEAGIFDVVTLPAPTPAIDTYDPDDDEDEDEPATISSPVMR